MKKQPEQMPEDQRFHDTYLLLKKYRDVVWGLELSVQQVKRRFQMEAEVAGSLGQYHAKQA